MLVFLVNLVYSLIFARDAAPRPTRGARSRSSGSCPRRCPVHNFERIPVDRLRPVRLRHAAAAGRRRTAGDGGGLSDGRGQRKAAARAGWSRRSPREGRRSRPSRRTSARARCRSQRGCCAARRRSSSSRSCSRTSTCARSTRITCGGPRTSTPSQGSGRRSSCARAQRAPRDRSPGAG